MTKEKLIASGVAARPLISRFVFLSILCTAFLTMPFLGTGTAGEQPCPEEPPWSFAPLAKDASPSVVNISTVKVIEGRQGMSPFMAPFGEQDPFKDFFDRYFGRQMPKKFKQRSLGSGFFIDKAGYILTNNHVVEETEEIKVTFGDNNEYEAKIIGRDPKTDLALIKIDSQKDVKPLPLGDSDTLNVGDWVIAIGSPFGLGNTVTAGIVSAKYRRIGASAYDDYIQTDASINPGNSGGPLLNLKGEVVGINTAIFSRSGGNVGIGFAVPINIAKVLLPQLKKGEVIRGWLGVVIQEITPELKDKLGLQSEKGALVADVAKDGPAEKAGIQRGDVIVSYDGKDVEEMQDLPLMVASTPVGKEVSVTVVRKGERKSFTVKIEKLKEEKEEEEAPAAGKEQPELGMDLEELNPELASRLGVSETSGVIVTQVVPQSPAADAGIRPGDIIREVDQRPIKNMEDFNRAISEYKAKETILFLIERQGQTMYLTLTMGE